MSGHLLCGLQPAAVLEVSRDASGAEGVAANTRLDTCGERSSPNYSPDIRLALGSSRPELLRLIVLQAMRLILTGGVIGIAGAWFLDRLLASMLVGVKVHDPITLSLALALMTLIALMGSCVPARNAGRTNMTSVLHSE